MKKSIVDIVRSLREDLEKNSFNIHKEIKISKTLSAVFFSNGQIKYFTIYKNGEKKYFYGFENGQQWESFIFTDYKKDCFYFNSLSLWNCKIDENKNFIIGNSYGLDGYVYSHLKTNINIKDLIGINVRYFDKHRIWNIYGEKVREDYIDGYQTKCKKISKYLKKKYPELAV